MEQTAFELMPSSIPIFPASLFITSIGASRAMLMILIFFHDRDTHSSDYIIAVLVKKIVELVGGFWIFNDNADN